MQIGSDAMPKAKRIMYKGQEYTLSKDEINQMRKGKVTADAFDERIAKGWNIKDAVYLNHNFVPFKNGVYLAVPVFNDTYYIKRSDFEDMRQKHNLSTQKYSQELENNLSKKLYRKNTQFMKRKAMMI